MGRIWKQDLISKEGISNNKVPALKKPGELSKFSGKNYRTRGQIDKGKNLEQRQNRQR